MANCTYTYKNGRTFSSELALEEFLLNNEKYGLVGDEVFSLSTELKKTEKKIAARAKDAERVIGHRPVMLDTDLFEEYVSDDFPAGVVAVTEALKMYRNGEDRLFPVFDLDNYWAHKVPNWNVLEYWTTGITNSKGEFIRADDLEIKAVFGDVNREDISKTPMPDQIENGKKTIEKMWALQGFMGTGVHRMIAAYWQAVHDHRTDYKDAIEKALDFELVKNPKPRFKQFEGIKYSEIIPKAVKDNILKQCKEIHERLKSEFMTDPNDPNEELLVIPEVSAITEINDFTNPAGGKINLAGNLDLIVVDKEGNINIIDYKTSPKEYNDYNSAKKRTFYYQLATYQRMIEQAGFSMGHKSNVYIIPIKFEGFTLNPEEDDIRKLITFNGLSLRSSDILERLDIKSGPDADTINANLDEFIPRTNQKPTTDGEILAKVKEFTDKKFPVFGKANEITTEYVIKRLKKKGADKMNPNTKNYTFKMGNKVMEADTFEKLVDKVWAEYQKTEEHTQERTIGIKSIIQEAIKNGKVEIKAGHSNRKYSREGWMEDTLKRYANGNYEILDDYSDACERLGIILLKNIHTNKIDVLVCDTNKRDFDDEILLGGDLDSKESRRKTLTGTFIADIDAKTKPQELVMDSTYGNIKLMLVLAAINLMEDLFSVGDVRTRPVLGEITLFNQYHNEGWSASNEQLMYNFRELNHLDGTEKDIHFGSTIQVAKYIDLVKHLATEILATQKDSRWDGLQSAVDATLNFLTNPIRLKAELVKLAHSIEDHWRLTNDTNARNLEGDRAEAYRFLSNLYFAIAELSDVKFKQQITDHDDFLNLKGILDALRNGWSGNRLDNPGMLDSDTLNKIGKQLNTAYQNTRDEVKGIAKKVFELSEKLKKEKNFGYLQSRTFGNEASLYRNMYDESHDDDLYFKNPFEDNTLSATEREYLKYSLFLINKNRYGIRSMDELQDALFEDNKYLRVPLTRGSDASKMAYKGMLETIKEKFAKLIPTQENVRELFKGLLVDPDLLEDEGQRNKYRDKNAELWEMNTEFDAGEYEDARRKMMTDYGKNYFERDLELLTMKHCYAYILRDNVNDVFPIIKACAFQLEMSGVIMNTRFAEDIQYLHDFITAKVLNMSIQDPKWEQFSYVAGKLMSGASKLALAFNPRQWYQAIDGLWKDISLIIRKPDGTYAFNQEHMRKAFVWAYSDITHNWGDSKSLGQYLNELYGINDMDMNTYINKIKPNQFGFFNFGNMMFHFASRPDYYNRMTIFGAHMMADGCFEAHDEEGRYDWTKDKRYDVFAKYCKNEDQVPAGLKEKYNEQKARYIAAAKQFEAEGAKYINENGESVEFELNLKNPIPLPRAYTVQEAESIKSLADLVYGYYSHEKKSLIQSTTAGALFMQMNTYWSSKKNQWFAPGGVRMMGKMVWYKEHGPNGEEIPYYVDENGEPTDKDTGVPYMVWQGLYQEGIMVTLASVLHDAYYGDENGNKGLGNAIDKYWNIDDENLRTAYRNNLKQFAFDTTAFLFLGMVTAPALETAVTSMVKEAGNGSLGTALINNTAVNLVSMFSTSTDDFNMTKSVFGRGIQWTPFSLTTLTSTYQRLSSAITGNSDWYDSLVKLAAATRTQECLFDCIKINTLGRKIGQAA